MVSGGDLREPARQMHGHGEGDRRGARSSRASLPSLIDIDYGKWQGRTRDDVKAAEPERFNSWMKQPHLTMIKDAFC